nr:hypothetical protein [Micromonospora sp. KC723]
MSGSTAGPISLLQRRVTAGRDLPRLVSECPAHYVLFDLLADAGGQVILDLPLSRRRARLHRLLADAPTQLTVTPQTADMRQVADWLLHWTAAGIEGVVSKRLDGQYQPGRRGWSKFHTYRTIEMIIGGVTGSINDPAALLIGRLDRRGRLRYTGRTHPLRPTQRRELSNLLAPAHAQRPAGPVAHPWPQPLPASWSGQLDRPEPLPYAPRSADGRCRGRRRHRIRTPPMAPPRPLPAASP